MLYLKRTVLAFFVFTIFCGNFTYARLPDKGVLPDEGTATKVAEAILIGAYGDRIMQQRPLVVKSESDHWVIDGQLHCPKGNNCKGGTAHIEINKLDGRVRTISHSK